MTEAEFLNECERVLALVEDAIDRSDADIDTERNGPVLELEFDDGSKVIVNGNTPVREIWVAAKSGGFHFRHDGRGWIDTRSGESLADTLKRCVGQQANAPVVFDGL